MTILSLQDTIQLTPVRSEAEILRRIYFWMTKASTKKDGKLWIIKTAKEFIQEGCTYSEITIKRALKALKDKGLIILHHSRHPYTGVPRASWIRVVAPFEVMLDKVKVVNKATSIKGKGIIKAPFKVSGRHLKKDHDDTFHIQEDNRNKTGTYIEADKSAPNYESELGNKVNGKRETTSSIIGNDSSNKRLIRTSVPISLNSRFYELFLALMRERYFEHVPDPKNKVTLKFTKSFLKSCRDDGLSDQKIESLLRFIISHWPSFSEFRKSALGTSVKAKFPN
ncbi:MAG: hypothetical protein ABJ275_04820, partial [Maricaulaceae bacterium]